MRNQDITSTIRLPDKKHMFQQGKILLSFIVMYILQFGEKRYLSLLIGEYETLCGVFNTSNRLIAYTHTFMLRAILITIQNKLMICAAYNTVPVTNTP